ncbi:MAG: MTH1187 family thiamine-binding protein [Methanothrix sp.]|nr:MTH1187 family thiamine-binding protein [Methanothrix sp.]MCX8206275.1 MTH1187 family thiamine-binding protein [Methanothrix sp.]
MIVAEFSVIPMGAGTSAGRYIRAVHEMLKSSGIRFVPGAMSTAIEAESIEQVCMIIERANKILTDMEVQRVITTVMIDYRLDKEISIDTKLKALERRS